ncbi:MAG: hypothetical protein RJA70_4946, partial [Pseudomonadota bacterium]
MTTASNTQVQTPVAQGPGAISAGADSLDFQLAYESTAADRLALAEEDVLDVNLDVPYAVAIATGALARISEQLPAMQALPV